MIDADNDAGAVIQRCPGCGKVMAAAIPAMPVPVVKARPHLPRPDISKSLKAMARPSTLNVQAQKNIERPTSIIQFSTAQMAHPGTLGIAVGSLASSDPAVYSDSVVVAFRGYAGAPLTLDSGVWRTNGVVVQPPILELDWGTNGLTRERAWNFYDVETISNRAAMITWLSQTGRSYMVQGSEAARGPYRTLGMVGQVGTGRMMTNLFSVKAPAQFYRLVWQ